MVLDALSAALSFSLVDPRGTWTQLGKEGEVLADRGFWEVISCCVGSASEYEGAQQRGAENRGK